MTTATCRRCNRARYHHARGLCEPCYRHLRAIDRLDGETTRIDRAAQIRPLLEIGLSHREIGHRLGITKNAVQLTVKRMRARKDTVAMDAYTGTTWQHLFIPPPPDDPACAGVTPDLFTELDAPLMRGGSPTPHTAAQLDVAFSYCDGCPVRDWCVLEATLPHRSSAAIVAGGALWKDGGRLWTDAQHKAWRRALSATPEELLADMQVRDGAA